MNVKPFLKWAGGKSQILQELESRIPTDIKKNGIIDRYVEPFVGGGAFFFLLKNKYEINETFLIDINRELILGYKTIQQSPLELIERLNKLFIGREHRMIELKREVNTLLERLGQSKKYEIPDHVKERGETQVKEENREA